MVGHEGKKEGETSPLGPLGDEGTHPQPVETATCCERQTFPDTGGVGWACLFAIGLVGLDLRVTPTTDGSGCGVHKDLLAATEVVGTLEGRTPLTPTLVCIMSGIPWGSTLRRHRASYS